MKVKFLPSGREEEIGENESVLELAQRTGITIYSVCNGMPSCAECRVKIVSGEGNVLPPNSKEKDLLGSGYFVDSRRLACQLQCFGDIEIDLTEQIEKAKLRQTKRPQGSVKRDQNEKSYAVTGNLIDQDDEFGQTEETDTLESTISTRSNETATKTSRPNQGDSKDSNKPFKKSFKNNQNKRSDNKKSHRFHKNKKNKNSRKNQQS
jgi:ferredoxin